MNIYNKAFHAKVEKASKALAQLNALGCAITGMHISDSGNEINILPPPHNKLHAVQIRTHGDQTGRSYHMQARLCGCTVRWQSTEQSN